MKRLGSQAGRGYRHCVLLVGSALVSIVVAACGSSDTTSAAESASVVKAEHQYRLEARRAHYLGTRRCRGLSEQAASARCYEGVAGGLEADARARFAGTITHLLDQGLGDECREALEEASTSMNSVLAFSGGIASRCRSES